LSPHALFAPLPNALWKEHRYSPRKVEFLSKALSDGAHRAGRHFDLMSGISQGDDIAKALVEGAKENELSTLVAMQPFTGPLADEIPQITHALAEAGVSLQLVRRPDDVELMKHATAGFFGFWKKTAKLRDRAPL